MLVDEVVDPGWLTEKQFYQGFALVQVQLSQPKTPQLTVALSLADSPSLV